MENEYEYDYEERYTLIYILTIISKWFIRIGMVIAVILLLYFIFTLKFFNALLFIIGLLIAYIFGYFFMFCLDKLLSI